MLQRNDTGSPQILPTLNLSAEPGGVIEHDSPISGFTQVDEEGTEVTAEPEVESDDEAPRRRTRKADTAS